METMKYPNVPGGTNMAVSGSQSHVDEVDSLFTSCWQNSNSNDFMDTNKLILDSSMNNLGSDKLLLDASMGHDDCELENKPTIDILDNLLLSSSQSVNNSLAELKPLPPFTGYTANLSINGIQGHHYHTISQRIPEENNNTYNNYNEQNIVSSSTCNISADSAGDKMFSVGEVVKIGYMNPDSVSGAKLYEDCSQNADSLTQVKTEMVEYDISSIEDIAAIIGSAIADTTVPNNNNPDSEGPTTSRDSWMDLDAWIDGACVDQHKNLMLSQDGLSEFMVPTSNANEYNNNNKNNNNNNNQNVEYNNMRDNNMKQQQQHQHNNGSTLQSLLTHGYMPLLQNRLQNGPSSVKQEAPSSTNYSSEMISTSSPPANVGSTTDNLMLTVNGRFMNQYSVHGMEDHRIRSPDMLQNYPHTTTTTPNGTKKSRNRAQKKQATSSTVFQSDQTLGLLGKEKPVHRCSVCNRGFLNKSNIKVHLRTHTGEKPFRCDTCAKAFRQKAHLLKHQQIHKRIGRD